jgi:hypothetical protein
MKKYLSALILVFVLISNELSAQEISRNYVGGSFGGSDFHVNDEHASPLIFSSLGIAPTLQYFYNGEKSFHYFEAAYFDDYLTTTADNFETINHRGRIRYSYFHSIATTEFIKQELKFFIGGAIGTYLCHSDYYYRTGYVSDARAAESWYWNSSIDLTTQLEFNLSEREFFLAQIFIPLISNVSRPDYSKSMDYNYVDNDWKFKMFGETEFITDNFSLDLLISYQTPLLSQINLQLNYEFYYSTYSEPKEISMYMNNLRAGLFFCF